MKPFQTSRRQDDTDESPEAYLTRSGIAFKRSGEELSGIECPECGDNEAFGMNAKTGQWRCYRASCSQTGNLWTFKKARGDLYKLTKEPERLKSEFERDLERGPLQIPTDAEAWSIALRESPLAESARAYLHKRGFSDRVIQFAGLGWTAKHPGMGGGVPLKPKGPRRSSASVAATVAPSEPGMAGMISIPYRVTRDDKPHLIKFRSVPPEPIGANGKPLRFTRMKGGKTTLYLPMGQPEKGRGLLLVGGEFDALSVVQALIDGGQSLDECPFVVAGVPSGEGSWTSECDRAIEEVEDVVFALDSDAAGAIATEKVSEIVGRHRSRKARWPDGAKDANEALQAGTLDVFTVLAMWNKAEPIGIAGVKGLSEIEDDVIAGSVKDSFRFARGHFPAFEDSSNVRDRDSGFESNHKPSAFVGLHAHFAAACLGQELR